METCKKHFIVMMTISLIMMGSLNVIIKRVSFKKELMPIALHPSRYWDWCMSEDEKKETEKLWT